MSVYYDRNGNCTTCGRPGSGLLEEVCRCLDDVVAHHKREDYKDVVRSHMRELFDGDES